MYKYQSDVGWIISVIIDSVGYPSISTLKFLLPDVGLPIFMYIIYVKMVESI